LSHVKQPVFYYKTAKGENPVKKSPLFIALTVFLLGIALLIVPTVGAHSLLNQSESYPDSLGIAPGNPAGAPEGVDLSLALESIVSPAYGTELQNNFLAQVPAITLEKTVGTDAGSCATEDNIFVEEGDMVYYCYTVTNAGDITLTNHTLVDSELMTIANNLPVTLGLSASYSVTQTATITQTTVNTATWTATDGISETAEAMDSAMVTVIPENGSAPNADIPDDNSTGVTDTISISESGTLTDVNV